MRYVLQEHAVTVDLPVELFKNEDRDGIKQRFDAVHQTRYGFSVPNEKAEIVSLRSAIIGEMRKPAFEPIAKGEARAGGRRRSAARARSISPATGFVDTPTYRPRRRSRPATGSQARR